MPTTGPAKFAVLLGLTLLLAACESSEERAERHYQSALALLAEGDLERATLEFRNVFELDGDHREARTTYARALREDGQSGRAYRQYLRLVEQYPDDLEGRVALAEMAIARQDWAEVRRHGARAAELAPDDPAVAIIGASLDYSAAIEAGDAAAQAAAIETARDLSGTAPDDLALRRILVDGAIRSGDTAAALAEVERTLEIAPGERSLYDTRLQLLAELGRVDEIEPLLRDMIDRFDADPAVVQTLMRFYLSQGRTGEAETFLRDFASAAEDPGTRRARQVSLVRFLLQTGGAEAALAELDGIVETADDPAIFRMTRASIRFDIGETGAAIAEMEDLLDGAEPSDETRTAQVALARMLEATDNRVGAQRLVDAVLEADATQTDALKMRAAWLIEDDAADAAIAALRTALDQAPEDEDAMTLMARAHLRNGNRDLARDFLSLAVEASDSAPAESLRYAEVLLEDDRTVLAEDVLLDALRQAPGDLSVLSGLGRVYVAMEDWPRTRQVEARLRDLGETGGRAADALQATRLAAEGRMEDAIAFLEGLATGDGGGADVAAQIAVVRARLASGDGPAAVGYAREALAEGPDSLPLQLTLAAALQATGEHAAAEEAYRGILGENGDLEAAWTGLIRALFAQGQVASAEAALEEALAAVPDALNLLWAQASLLERAGDIEGAIGIYERIYAAAPGSPVAANNLASLLSTYRDDEESLERAYRIARRLREAELPAFQDTYGWIAYRRGLHDEALEHLEPAAAALAADPLVQYHLAMTYLALGREGDALEQFRRTVELADPDDPRAQIARARAEIARIEAGAQEGATPGTE